MSKDVVPPFSLYTPHPRCQVHLSEESATSYDETLLIVASGDTSYDRRVLDKLSDEKVSTRVVNSIDKI